MRIEDFWRACRKEAGSMVNQLDRELCKIDEPFSIHVQKNILNCNCEGSPLQNVDDYLKNPGKYGWNPFTGKDGDLWFNTFPDGIKTKKIFPYYLAVCRGKMKLAEPLNAIMSHSRKMKKELSANQNKLVILLTDKWNVEEFRKYEQDFINHAINDRIWYVIILVTDYGYAQIPFLPNDRNALQPFEGQKIGVSMTQLEGRPIQYTTTGGAWNRYDTIRYQFDADTLEWSEQSFSGKVQGKIKEKDLQDFLEDVSWLESVGQNGGFPIRRLLDAPFFKLDIFGKKYEWDVTALEMNGDSRIKELQDTINKLIHSCKKSR